MVETLSATSSEEISNSLKSKFDKEIDLDKYTHYMTNMTLLDFDEQIFFNDLKIYRIQNNIIPENICLYINKFYSDNSEILRLCNIDLVRHYLKRNGIDYVSVFYDEAMEIGAIGLADSKFLATKNPKLSIVMFHEATHVIQFNNQKNDKNYLGYNYSMLKDTILCNEMDPVIYNRNHNRYLFEIDADICGEREYYNVLGKLNLLTEENKLKREKLKEKEQFRLSASYYLNINGYDYEKGILFDDIIFQNPTLLAKYPVLQIEYNSDGTRKEMIEILESLEKELSNGVRTEDEIVAISGCIFGEFYEVKDISTTLETLKKYVPKNKVILQLEKNLISELQMLINDKGLKHANFIVLSHLL